ncbi:MAG: glycosyltransferase family 1 protein [Actinomycetota bacterium]
MNTVLHDLQPVQCWAYRDRGIGRYTADLARAIDDVAPEHGVDVTFVVNEQLGELDRVRALGLERPVVTWDDVAGSSVDVLHTTGPMDPVPFEERRVPVDARRQVVTCYDLIPLRFPDVYLTDPLGSARYRARLGTLLAADAIVTDSESAADDLHELLGIARARLTPVGGGCDERFRPPTDSLADRLARLRREVPAVRPGFVLGPTGWDWRKNNEGLVAAYARLPIEVRRAHQLVIVAEADAEHRDRIAAWSADHGLAAGEVVLTGHVADDVLVTLYQSTDLVVLPSRYEGFGLPVVEAKRCGAVVVCGDNSALREVLLEPLARFDADDVDQLGAVMLNALTNEVFRSIVADASVCDTSWNTVAGTVVSVYEQLLGGR